MTQSKLGGLHCGSRIAWPLRRIANPVVSHLGSSNLPCRAINKYPNTSGNMTPAQMIGIAVVFLLLLLYKKTRRAILFILLSYKLVFKFFKLRPSNKRAWVNDNKFTASISWNEDEVTIQNVRDFNWRTTRDYDERWIEMVVKPSTVKNIWFVLEYFDPIHRQLAHTILSFEFEDGTFLACSIEARREKGERYHPVTGMLRQFELIYVWGTEEDLIGVRSRCRKKSTTHLFKAKVLREESKQLLLESYFRRTEQLNKKPEWYNSITNTCTTNIAHHVNEVYPGRIPKSFAILLPGLSPKLLEQNNLVEIETSMDDLLITSIIDEKSLEWDESTSFSELIRT